MTTRPKPNDVMSPIRRQPPLTTLLRIRIPPRPRPDINLRPATCRAIILIAQIFPQVRRPHYLTLVVLARDGRHGQRVVERAASAGVVAAAAVVGDACAAAAVVGVYLR